MGIGYLASVSCVTVGFALAATAAPAVVVTPTVGHPKIATQVSGTGFTANEAVDVYFDTTDMVLAFTSSTGAFPAHELDIPANATPGTHWITAIGRKSGDGLQVAFRVQTVWAQYGFEAHDRGRNPYENVVDTNNVGHLDVAWTYPTGNTILSSPAYYYYGATNFIYFGSNDDKLYAVTTAGDLAWSAMTGGPIESSAAVANGDVYVGSYDGKVYAFNYRTGAPSWTFTTGGEVTSSPTVVGNTLYIGSGDHSVYALNARTGTLIWSYTTGGEINSSTPAVSNGIVYIGSDDHKLYALNATTGAAVWAYATGSFIEDSPAVSNNAVYFGSEDAKVYALNAKTGNLIWEYTTGDFVADDPAVVDGTVFISSYDGNTYALDAQTGAVKWSDNLDVPDQYPMSIANGVGYLGVNSGIAALDIKTGVVLWSAATSTASRPAIVNGQLYVGSSDSSLYDFALDAGFNAAYSTKRLPPSYATLHPDYRLKPR